MKTRPFLLLALVGCFASGQAAIQLSHNGSIVDIDENTATVDNWVVGGTDHVFQHRYYFRTGSGTAASLVSTIGAPSVTLLGSRGVEVVYQNAALRVTLTYMLTAAANGMTADLAESVLVENLGGATSFTLLQYNDYDMNTTAGNDIGERLNSSTIRISDSVVTAIESVEGGTPIPNFTEIDDSFPDLRDDIETTVDYVLNTAAGGGIGETLSGDISYAFQWDRAMGAGGSFVVSTDKVTAVPEPATVAALGLGLAALMARKRKRTA